MSKSLDQFRILRPLTEGGMADLHLASSIQNPDEIVVIKRISQSFKSQTDFQSMFERELKICSLVKHPNLIETFEAGQNDQGYFLVLEYIHGINLKELIQKRQQQGFSQLECAYIFHAVAQGLSYLHFEALSQLGCHAIIHRDLSPHNIMIGKNGAVKIIDFGISKVQGESDSTVGGNLKGKFSYMSPEQSQGKALTTASDIFSLALVIYEVLTQKKFFENQNEIEILNQLRDWQTPELEDLPSVFRPILQKMLSADPVARPDSKELARTFAAILGRAANQGEKTLVISQQLCSFDHDLEPLQPLIVAEENNVITLYDFLSSNNKPVKSNQGWLQFSFVALVAAGTFMLYNSSTKQTVTQLRAPAQTADKTLLQFENHANRSIRVNGRTLSKSEMDKGVLVSSQDTKVEYYDTRSKRWRPKRIN